MNPWTNRLSRRSDWNSNCRMCTHRGCECACVFVLPATLGTSLFVCIALCERGLCDRPPANWLATNSLCNQNIYLFIFRVHERVFGTESKRKCQVFLWRFCQRDYIYCWNALCPRHVVYKFVRQNTETILYTWNTLRMALELDTPNENNKLIFHEPESWGFSFSFYCAKNTKICT